MTYEQWLEEMKKGQSSALYEKKKLIDDAASKCSKETREQLKNFLGNLGMLFGGPAGGRFTDPIASGTYHLVIEGIPQELALMMSRYEPPAEFLSKPGVADALIDILDAVETADTAFPMPDFKSSPQAEAAFRKDPDTFGAQMVAMDEIRANDSPRAFIKAAASIHAIKKDPAFKAAMKDPNIRTYLSGDVDKFFFVKGVEKTRMRQDEENAKTFKQLGEEAAKLYREKQISYAGLELTMNVLRAIAKDKTKSDDRRKYDNVMIRPSEIKKMAAQFQTVEKAPEEYQAELAESNVMVQDRIAERVHDVYDARPVFNETFDNPGSEGDSYRRQDFEKHMKEIDITGLSFGPDNLSNSEFGSLSFLAVIDPDIAGSTLSIGGKSTKIENGSIGIAASMLLHCTIAFGDATKVVNGQTVYGPEMRVGSAMEQCVAPARDKTARALASWRDGGDIKPLAKLIAVGVNSFVNDIRHTEVQNGSINKHLAVYANMVKGTLDLLKRSPILMKAAGEAGLKQETVQEMEGIIMANRIEKAGQEAKRRLLESAQGLMVLNSFEKEQCILAAERYDAMINDFKKAENEWRESDEFNKITQKIVDIDDGLLKKYGGGYKKNPDAVQEKFRLQYEYLHEQTKLLKRPGVFRTLGRDGVKGLDRMIPEGRLEKEKNMSFVELAQDLGLTETREIKTTAKQVYDQLTKEYKAHTLKYDLYAARLRIMRELTGDNKDAKIDIKALDDALTARQNKSLGQIEEEIHKITDNEYGGVMGRRLTTVYKTYGIDPAADKRSLEHNKYTEAQFAQLGSLSDRHLSLGFSGISSTEFAALGVAVTQVDPKLGAVVLAPRTDKRNEVIRDENGQPFYENLVEEQTVENATYFRTIYVYDLDQTKDAGARYGIGQYFSTTIAPARMKACEVLENYKKDHDPKELGRIIGEGIHNIMGSVLIADKDSKTFNETSVMEGNILGKLVIMAEKDPAVKAQVLKHISPDELETARGLGTLYEIVRGAGEARQMLEDSCAGKKTLSSVERTACIELMLREKALGGIAGKLAKDKFTDDFSDRLASEVNFDNMGNKNFYSIAMSSIIGAKIAKETGFPDYVRQLGIKGQVYARDLLDTMMPGREAFMKLSDREILDAIKAKNLSDKDPLMNDEYKKHEKNAAEKGLHTMTRGLEKEKAVSQKTI